MADAIDSSARIVDSEVGTAEVREFVTIHDSEIGDRCRIYERSSVKKCQVRDSVDINAGTYVENAEIASNVQIGPNCSLVGVTHDLGPEGMTFRNDVFERIVLHEGAFVGAGSVVGPGVEIGPGSVVAAGTTVTDDVGPKKLVRGSPPDQRICDLEAWLERRSDG